MKRFILFLPVFIIIFFSGYNSEAKEEPTASNTGCTYIKLQGEKYNSDYCRYTDSDDIKACISSQKDFIRPMNSIMAVGMCQLRYLRKKRRITQIALSESLNIPKPYISMWEKNKCMPDKKYSKQLADYFNVSIDELLK